MSRRYQVVGSGVLALGLTACGFMSGAGGGSGDGNTPPPNQDNALPSPSPTPAVITSTDVPLAVLSVDELLKSIGVTGFAPIVKTDDELAVRLSEIKALSAYGTFNNQIKFASLKFDASNSVSGCDVTFNDPFRFSHQNTIDGFNVDLEGGLKEGTTKVFSGMQTLANIADVPAYALRGYSTETVDGDKKVQDKVFLGASEDQIVVTYSETTRKKDKLDSLVNCARIFTKSSKLMKSACSWSQNMLGRSAQLNDFSEEILMEGQYSFKDQHIFIALNRLDDKVSTTTQFKQTGPDKVSFDMLEESYQKPTYRNVGEFQFGDMKYNRYESCSITSSTKS